MLSRKKFIFTSSRDNIRIKSISVEIPEVIDPQYGMFTWPSAPVLAQYLFHNQDRVHCKKVLELGAGTALPGIVAAKLGASVILSDAEEFPKCLENCLASCKANDFDNIEILPITWGRVNSHLVGLKDVDFILGSDIFYDKKDFEDIIFTIAFIMEQNPSAVFLTTYQLRDNYSVAELLHKWNLESKKILLNSFDADDALIGGHDMSSKHEIHLFEISRKQKEENQQEKNTTL